MAPLIFLVLGTAAVLLAGRLGVRSLRPWPVAVRAGTALMFVVTGISHFVGMRADLIAMVPPVLPAPEFLVTLTGVLELAGAAGLLWTRTAPWAAGSLALLLLAMFPANVYRTLGDDVPWASQLVPRTVLQVVFLAAVLSIVGHHVRAVRRRDTTVAVGDTRASS